MAFRLSPIFTNHMVFQAGRKVRIFGTSDDGARLTLEWFGRAYVATPVKGRFRFDLPQIGVLRHPFAFALSDGNDVVEISGCLAGDVILVSGQSNMQFLLKDSIESEAEANPLLRLFSVPALPYPAAYDDFPTTYQKQTPVWKPCDKDSAAWFSAVGYHLGMRLQKELDIPIGVVNCSNGDTSVFSWTPRSVLEKDPSLSFYVKAHDNALANYPSAEAYKAHYLKQLPILHGFYDRINQGVAAGLTSEEAHRKAYEIGDPTLPMGPMHHNRPGGMFDTMVSTLIPFSFRAAIFYQGCSDHERGRLWGRCYQAMVQAWREAFELPQWPFLAIQVAGYSYPGVGPEGIMTVREGQSDSMDLRDHRYLSSAVDLGEEQNIHPRRKKAVGERAALVLLERLYGIGENGESPMVHKVIRKKHHVVVQTAYNKLPLQSRSGKCLSFRYSVDGTAFLPVSQAECKGSTVQLTLPREAAWVDYAWDNFPICDIFSANDLPLLPFRKVIEDEPTK
jgi:sialate O-acetylesterase